MWCVCMSMCAHVHMCVHVHTRVYMWVHACVHACVCVCRSGDNLEKSALPCEFWRLYSGCQWHWWVLFPDEMSSATSHCRNTHRQPPLRQGLFLGLESQDRLAGRITLGACPPLLPPCWECRHVWPCLAFKMWDVRAHSGLVPVRAVLHQLSHSSSPSSMYYSFSVNRLSFDGIFFFTSDRMC